MYPFHEIIFFDNGNVGLFLWLHFLSSYSNKRCHDGDTTCIYFHREQMKLREANVFSHVSLLRGHHVTTTIDQSEVT